MDRALLRWNGWGLAEAGTAAALPEAAWDWLARELGVPSLIATPAAGLSDATLPPSRLTPGDLAQLANRLGLDAVATSPAERALHTRGRSYFDLLLLRAGDLTGAPDAVLYPADAEAVDAVIAWAGEADVAVVPFGGGSSVVGGVTAAAGERRACVSLDLTRMNRLLRLDAAACTATAEAGIYGPALEKALTARGYTLGHTPQSFEFSTLGGWIAARGAGQASARYGKAERWFVSARVATPVGRWDTEGFPASAAGPRLGDLVLGGEGALGIITEATIRIRPVPERRAFAAYLFRDFASAGLAARRIAQSELPVAMVRLSDPAETAFYRNLSRIQHPPSPTRHWLERTVLSAARIGESPALLLLMFEGPRGLVAGARAGCGRIARDCGGFGIGGSQGERWLKNRFAAPYLRDVMLDHGVGVDTLETATNWANIDALYQAVDGALREAIAETAPAPGARGIVMCHLSHVYPDGASLYFTFIFPRALTDEVQQWRLIKARASDAIAANGGTISHHHGVGEDHRPWLGAEKGAVGTRLLRAIKRELDPAGILNPGKLIP